MQDQDGDVPVLTDDTRPAPQKPVLLLAGTTEARALAWELARQRPDITLIPSLAGRTDAPLSLPGAVRRGGFGGRAGLEHFLRQQAIRLVIDASHPFAHRITAHAQAACAACACPLLRLQRPPWQPAPADDWHPVADEAAAARALPTLPRGARVFLALGRQHLAAFALRPDLDYLVRLLSPVPLLLPRVQMVVAPPCRDPGEERALLQQWNVKALVVRDSGGTAGAAKLVAARQLGLPVYLIRRPPGEDNGRGEPSGPGGAVVRDVPAALAAVNRLLPPDLLPPDRP